MWWWWWLCVSIVLVAVPTYRLHGVPIDGIFLHTLFLYTCQQAIESVHVHLFILGLWLASFERYCIGYVFHLRRFEIQHEAFHELLRDRKRTSRYLLADHVIETVAYAVLLGLLFLFIDSPSLRLGVLTEHVIGQRIRWRTQIGMLEIKDGWWGRVQNNYDAYYWYHILVNPHTCRGFSAPFWDTLRGSNPFASRAWWCGPFPYMEFFVVDYRHEFESIILPAWQRYCADPAAFKQQMLQQIIQ